MRYNPNIPWGGTDNPVVPAYPMEEAPTRNYGDLLYNLPDLNAFRALDHTPLAVQEDTDNAPAERLITRRLLGALARPLTRYSAGLDQVGEEYDPARAEAGANAAFHLRLCGYPLPPDLPPGWALALLRALPDLLPVGRTETYLRTAEVIYGRGQRRVSYAGEERTQQAITARGVVVNVTDAQQPGADNGRSLSIAVIGPADDAFMRLLSALRPAAFSAVPYRLAPQTPLLAFGEQP